MDELYAELLWDDAALDAGIRDGRLVRDERLAHLLPMCPDPLSGAPAGSVRVEPEPDELRREQAELEFDAMHLLGRTERWLIVQRERARGAARPRHSATPTTQGWGARRRLAAQRERSRALREHLRVRRVAAEPISAGGRPCSQALARARKRAHHASLLPPCGSP